MFRGRQNFIIAVMIIESIMPSLSTGSKGDGGGKFMGSRRRGSGRRKVGRKKRRMRAKIRHRK
jgi:hypothetical protein